MPRYSRLDIDADFEPWQVAHTLALEATLKLEDGRTIGVSPEQLAQPLGLEVTGKQPGALMTFARGFRLESRYDVIASPELVALLSTANLPQHANVACLATPMAFDLRTGRRRKRIASRAYHWLWWVETFGARVDLARSRFLLRYPDGRLEEGRYEALDDLVAVQRRAASTLGFDVSPATLEWTDPRVGELDLVPFQSDLFLTERLAAKLAAANLGGLRVVPPRGVS